jgi:hypothetical protein
MTQQGCICREYRLGAMRTVTVSNRFLSATILPEKGCDIYSLVYKPRALDILWKSPWGLRRPGSSVATSASSEAAWLEHYEGGWQLIFPNGGDACNYKGADLNFHGEASVSTWDYTVRRRTAASVSVDFSVELARSPFRLHRTFTVEKALAALLIEERVENRGEEDMHFMWGHHPAFGAPFLDTGCRLQAPARSFLAHDTEISPFCRLPAGARGSWPVLDGKDGRRVDLSIMPPASERVTEFGYLCDLDAGWYALTNDAAGVGFGLAWPERIFPYLWFWQELRGSFGYPWYGRCYVMAVEPFTSIPGAGLTRAIGSATAPVLRAGGCVEARLAAVLFDAAEVDSIEIDGTVNLRTTSRKRLRSRNLSRGSK